ncbi:MAG: hypothetical protein [Olavius algarvensis Gamma 1 endosymbiont]|nr:MAG: hypothetical protein [Olavius algarvensis Gamma 1 endosymbiont]
MADLQNAIQTLLDELVESGEEMGLQAAVYIEGQLVADCFAGWRSQDRETLVSKDTLFTVYSCTKGVVASAVHILAERGIIDYERPVTEYWPEFAEAGKGSVTVAQALNHLAGIPQTIQIKGKSTSEIWANLDLCVAEVARLKPIFPPGSTACYHGLTFGWIVEGIVRGVGRSLSEVVAEEIARPLHIGDEMYLGTPASEHGRMATPFEKPPTGELPEIDPLVLRCVPLPDLVEALNQPEVRSSQVAAGNMSTTAQALARHYAALVGEVDGCRLVSETHLERVFSHRSDLPDVTLQRLVTVLPQETPRAGGYQMNTGRRDQIMYYGPNPRTFGHNGYGGSFGCADPDAKVALGYTKTLLHTELIREPFSEKSFSEKRFIEMVYGNL